MLSDIEQKIQQLPGVRPINQRRSQRAMARLIEVSEPLIREDHFDAIPVERFVAAAELSIGAFYSRFEDKEAFFRAIAVARLSEFVERGRRVGQMIDAPESDLDLCVDALVDLVVQFSRDYRGYMRSAIRRARGDPEASPLRSAGRQVIDICRGAVPKIRLPAGAEAAYIFGMQTIYAVCGHSATNDPGPILLDDPRLNIELGHVVSAAWGAPRPR